MNGLASLSNNIAAQGRYGDSMLVHMSPGEVGGLQALAKSQGTSLTTNPTTGLPEAFKLKDLLPAIAGFALGPAGLALMPAWGAGLAVGGIEALRTKDLGRGLMAGLGAYGGAGLGEALMGAGAASTAAPITDATLAQGAQAVPGLTAQAAPSLAAAPTTSVLGSGLTTPAGSVSTLSSQGLSAPMADRMTAVGAQSFKPVGATGMQASGFPSPMTVPGPAAGGTPPGFLDRYTTAMGGTKGALAGTAGMVMPLLPGPEPIDFPTPEDPYANYEGPYKATRRQVSYPSSLSSREYNYFTPSNPIPFQDGGAVEDRKIRMPGADYNVNQGEFNYNFRPVEIQGGSFGGGSGSVPATIGGKGGLIQRFMQMAKEKQQGKPGDLSGYDYDPMTRSMVKMAKGGSVPTLEDGGFVLTKKAVDGLGKGDNARGQRAASMGLGALPIKGKGHGTSDSIKTTIDGKVPARVSNGEAYIPRKKVQQAGGAKKLYALMKKAERKA